MLVVEKLGGISKLDGFKQAEAFTKYKKATDVSRGISIRNKKDLTLDDLCERLSSMINTKETYEIFTYYHKLDEKYHKYLPKRAEGLPVPSFSKVDKNNQAFMTIRKQCTHQVPLETDNNGNEILYRSIPPKHFNDLFCVKKLTATGETSITGAKNYITKYDGIKIQFILKEGTMNKLLHPKIGRIVNDRAAKELKKQKNIELEPQNKDWAKNHCGIKSEGRTIKWLYYSTHAQILGKSKERQFGLDVRAHFLNSVDGMN